MATFQIEWKKSALRELKQLDRKIIPRVISVVESLSTDPFPSGARKLQGSDNTYRIRVGQYRIVYEIFQARIVIVILRVRHSKDAYR